MSARQFDQTRNKRRAVVTMSGYEGEEWVVLRWNKGVPLPSLHPRSDNLCEAIRMAEAFLDEVEDATKEKEDENGGYKKVSRLPAVAIIVSVGVAVGQYWQFWAAVAYSICGFYTARFVHRGGSISDNPIVAYTFLFWPVAWVLILALYVLNYIFDSFWSLFRSLGKKS